MSDNPLTEILAGLTPLDKKVDARFDALSGDVSRLRTELSARMDALSNQFGFLRDDNETTFHAADRATRINRDVNQSFNDQLASMARLIRTLDSRVRTIEDGNAA
jgi:hypothetical protein